MFSIFYCFLVKQQPPAVTLALTPLNLQLEPLRRLHRFMSDNLEPLVSLLNTAAIPLPTSFTPQSALASSFLTRQHPISAANHASAQKSLYTLISQLG